MGLRAVAWRSRSACRRASAPAGISRAGRPPSSTGIRSAPPLEDPPVDDRSPLLVRDPECGVLLRAQVVHRLALLLDPGEVLLVVPAAAHVAGGLQDPVRLLAAEDGEAAARLLAVPPSP